MGRVAMVAFLILTNQDPFYGWSAGFVALCVNFMITTILSLLTPAAQPSNNAESQVYTLFQGGRFQCLRCFSSSASR